ncbi:hypothetical protein A7U60_g4481 [Sanghuangporus baumii]|uniref:Uncharacterized protein n=1 Tax=Sanghuangporus baumii TaxID=108892 RepID=A0A9Q5HYW8_SANBA|nr:hypothetical protein A7U60_g4481 [Sanghuangporus baumii]
MASYPVPPPSYQTNKSYSSTDEATEPLLNGQRAGPSTGPGAIYDQPAGPGALPDDFKYGVTVSESAPEIRNAFVRKVYSVLFIQILATSIVGGVLSRTPSAIFWVQTHPWSLYLPLLGTFINLGLLFWKRHSVPANYILLGTFTLLEAFTLGVVMAFYDTLIILEALVITLGIFIGLTLFTYQSKYDFAGMGPWLFGALIALVMTGFVAIIFPFNKTLDLIYAVGGALIFSGYVVYDTYMIENRLSPDEYIVGAISLYLDFINLFLSILRLLSNVEDS